MSKTRVRRSGPEKERHWRDVVRGQERSGQSVREYCRTAGVKESAFYWWRRELARRSEARKVARSRRRGGRKPALAGGPPGDDASLFVPIHVLAGNAPAGVEIHLGDGRMICVRRGFDRQTLNDVLAVLEGRPC